MSWLITHEYIYNTICKTIYKKIDTGIRIKKSIRKKITANYNSFKKKIQLKVYSHPVKNVWISSLILILIFWWIDFFHPFSEATEKFTKILSLILKIFGKKNCILPGLNCFLAHWQPVSSWVLAETLHAVTYLICYTSLNLWGLGW